MVRVNVEATEASNDASEIIERVRSALKTFLLRYAEELNDPALSQLCEQGLPIVATEVDGYRFSLRREPLVSPKSALTSRELEIEALAVKAFSNKEIARQLGISLPTVSTHLRHIYLKRGVTSRAALVRTVLQLV
jgi:DNA-binding CsgD family transcriptional regulator